MTWLTDDELTARLRDLESQWVERKRGAADRSGIRRNICAFANDLAGNIGSQHLDLGIVAGRVLGLELICPAHAAVDHDQACPAAEQAGDALLKIAQGVAMLGKDNQLLPGRGPGPGEGASVGTGASPAARKPGGAAGRSTRSRPCRRAARSPSPRRD